MQGVEIEVLAKCLIGYINGSEKRDSALINLEQALVKMEKAENPKLSDEETIFKAMQVRG